MTRLPFVLLAAAFLAHASVIDRARGDQGVLLTVRAFDARTGKPPGRLHCALLEQGARKAYAEFPGATFKGPRTPKAGDLLYVYRRYYDLARVRLDGPGAVDVKLTPAKLATLVLEPRGGRNGATDVPFRVSLALRPLAWKRKLVHDSYSIDSRDGKVGVRCPSGMKVNCLLDARGAIVFPLSFDLEPGQQRRLSASLPREVGIDRDPGFTFADAVFVADMLWVPPVSGAEVDAWLWGLRRRVLLDCLSDDRQSLRLLPDVPFHLFAVHGGRPCYRYVDRNTKTIALRGPFCLKRVAKRPRIDGEPAPEGSLIGPGRLTALTLSDVFAHELSGCVLRLGPVGEGWKAVALPTAGWITVWHPEIGLAHVQWIKGRPPVGRTYPGVLELRFTDGLASGRLGYSLTWTGSGRTRSAAMGLGTPQATVKRARTLLIRGLAPGTYTIDPGFSIETADGKPVGRVVGVRNIVIPPKKPHQVRLVPVSR